MVAKNEKNDDDDIGNNKCLITGKHIESSNNNNTNETSNNNYNNIINNNNYNNTINNNNYNKTSNNNNYSSSSCNSNLPWNMRPNRRRNKNLIKNPLYNVANIISGRNVDNSNNNNNKTDDDLTIEPTDNNNNPNNTNNNSIDIINPSTAYVELINSSPSPTIATFNPRVLPRLKVLPDQQSRLNSYFPDQSSRAPSEENVSLLAAGNGILEISPDKAGLVDELTSRFRRHSIFHTRDRFDDRREEKKYSGKF